MSLISEFSFTKGYGFKADDNIYISVFSDCRYPVFIAILKDKVINKILVTTDEVKKTFNCVMKNTKIIVKDEKTPNYVFKNSKNKENDKVYESGDIPLPPEFRDKSSSEISKEINENVDANIKYLEGKFDIESMQKKL